MLAPETSEATRNLPCWLSRYANGYHQWHSLRKNEYLFHYRPLGLVESFFDIDGTDFEGRADLNAHLILESRCSLLDEALKQRIRLPWTVLRTQHPLLAARARAGSGFLPGTDNEIHDRYFVVEELRSPQEAVQHATETMTFVGDYYPHVDVQDFYQHLMNTKRALDSAKALAKLFILPLEPLSQRTHCFQTILVAAHQITDGLTIHRWHSHFLDLLNLGNAELEQQLTSLCSHSVVSRLPPAQEDFYPPIRGTMARQRWFWAVSRILRHTRRPPPSSFPNPLRRATTLAEATPMPPTYSSVLSYSKVPSVELLHQRS
jgi:hypothetical protein